MFNDVDKRSKQRYRKEGGREETDGKMEVQMKGGSEKMKEKKKALAKGDVSQGRLPALGARTISPSKQ